MPLLEPITFVLAPMRQAAATPVITDKAENLTSCSFLKSFEAGSMTQCLQPLVTPTGIHSLSKSDPPTPPRGPPPTPRRRAHNELSRAYPPTPPRGPPPTPGDGDIFNSLSRCEPPSPPNGPPPTPQKYKADIFDSLSRRDPPTPPGGPPPTPGHCEDYDLFNSLSRRDPPTPPRGPPPSPCRRDIFNELSRCDPPTPPRGPPPSPRDCDDGHYSGLSRSSPPSPPPGPPPTPRRRSSKYDTWTPEETALLISFCRSGVELVSPSRSLLNFIASHFSRSGFIWRSALGLALTRSSFLQGWYQIAGLFHGKDGDVCRRKYREIQFSEQPLLNDCDNKRYVVRIRWSGVYPLNGYTCAYPHICFLIIASWIRVFFFSFYLQLYWCTICLQLRILAPDRWGSWAIPWAVTSGVSSSHHRFW